MIITHTMASDFSFICLHIIGGIVELNSSLLSLAYPACWASGKHLVLCSDAISGSGKQESCQLYNLVCKEHNVYVLGLHDVRPLDIAGAKRRVSLDDNAASSCLSFVVSLPCKHAANQQRLVRTCDMPSNSSCFDKRSRSGSSHGTTNYKQVMGQGRVLDWLDSLGPACNRTNEASRHH